jgi:hypothetical protein
MNESPENMDGADLPNDPPPASWEPQVTDVDPDPVDVRDEDVASDE